MAKKMLIDATHPEETRVVVVDGNKVDDFDFESINKRQLAGNIYLAKVTRVEPSLQAAFVEYGGNRHGFLAFSEIHPDYYQIPIADREALLAEEAREEEARRAREEAGENGDERPARSGRGRGRGRGRSKTGDAAAKAAVVTGLEVIDDAVEEVVHETSDVPRGLEIADVAADDAGDARDDVLSPIVESETKEDTANQAEVTGQAANEEHAVTTGGSDTENGDAETRATAGKEVLTEDEVSEALDALIWSAAAEGPAAVDKVQSDWAVDELGAPAPDTPEITDPKVAELLEAAAEKIREESETSSDDDESETEDDDNGSPPRTVAESSGLDDNDRVTEDIPEADERKKRPGEDATAEAKDGGAPASADAESGSTDPIAPEGNEDASSSTKDADDATAGATSQKRPRRRRRGRGEDAKRADAAQDDETSKAAQSASGSDDAADDDDDQTPDEPEQIGAEDTLEEAARARTRLRRRYKIQDVVKVRQILLVQVVKEERGNKGAALTTYLSLAGRYCVLMPNTARGGGISRKITNAGDRKRLREITGGLEVPQGMGLIVRTAGAERTKAEIKRDYEFLIRQWEQIRDLTLKSIAPTLIYEEGSLIKRSIRDIYSKEIDQILVEGETGYREAKEYMKMLMPSHAKNVQPYTDAIPLFSRYQVESYLNGMFNPVVQLKSGGYIVIGITEALVAIDVNSGRATKKGSIEETALQTNLEAADEVARQLRLRDLAGLIVIDFIDMDENRNNRAVEKRMKERLKNDRARIQVGRISAFGLMEMSRQRLRPGMLEATTQGCPTCQGIGYVRSDESMALSVLRELEEEGVRNRADQVTLTVPVAIANYLINQKRDNIAQIEQRHGISVNILADPGQVSPNFEIERSKSPKRRNDDPAEVVTAASVVTDEDLAEGTDTADATETDESKSRRRRGKRGGRRKRGTDQADGDLRDSEGDEAETPESSDASDDDGDERSRGRRSRGRRRGRGRRGDQGADGTESTLEASESEEATDGKDASQAREAEVAEEQAETSGDAPSPTAEPVEINEPIEPAGLEIKSVELSSRASAAADAPSIEPELPDAASASSELVSAPEIQPAAQEPPKKKRRGWWSFGA